MAVVDAYYRFIYVNIGAQGSANDAAVYNASSFAKALADLCNPMNVPAPTHIPDIRIQTPMMLVGDEAYPLRPYLMKPFSSRGLSASERVFNYRLSRARRVVENAFGILANRFRIFHCAMQMSPSSAEDVILAACTLHNYLRNKAIHDLDDDEKDSHDSAATPILWVNHQPRDTGRNYNAVSKRHSRSFGDIFRYSWASTMAMETCQYPAQAGRSVNFAYIYYRRPMIIWLHAIRSM